MQQQYAQEWPQFFTATILNVGFNLNWCPCKGSIRNLLQNKRVRVRQNKFF